MFKAFNDLILKTQYVDVAYIFCCIYIYMYICIFFLLNLRHSLSLNHVTRCIFSIFSGWRTLEGYQFLDGLNCKGIHGPQFTFKEMYVNTMKILDFNRIHYAFITLYGTKIYSKMIKIGHEKRSKQFKKLSSLSF